MSDSANPSEILLTIHGKSTALNQDRLISATVFKAKFSSLIGALKEADKSVNEQVAHEYFVSHLRIGSAECGLQERPLARTNKYPQSSINALYACANAIYRSNFIQARRYSGVGERLQILMAGVDEKFGYLELTVPAVGSITCDSVFKSQIDQFVAEKDNALQLTPKHYRGEAFDTFDCEFLELDFRGRSSRGILIITGAKVEIPCVFAAKFPETEMKAYLKQRVWVSGNAIYDGSTPLPARFEVVRMQKINQPGRPSEWKGALRPFGVSEWEAGDDVLPKQ